MRVGSQTWSADYFRIWQVSFPALIWNAAYTDAAKATVVTQAPLKSVARMAVMRAYGYLNWPVFRQFIAGNRELGALSRWSSMLLCLIPVSVMRWSYIAVLKAGLRPRTRNFSPEAALKWLRQPGRAVGR
jgi:hypothetical protein